jgi:hypothetical protein
VIAVVMLLSAVIPFMIHPPGDKTGTTLIPQRQR